MSLINRLTFIVQRFEHFLPSLFGRFPPHDGFCLAIETSSNTAAAPLPYQPSVQDLIGDGFLWAAPKHRRTVERRNQRKFGVLGRYWKLLRPKIHLRVCSGCGKHHEVGVLCATCYGKVKEETQLMQDKIQEGLGLSPVDKEVIVLYDGEKGEHSEEFWKGKRVVEMEKPRPKWFSRNLMQKSTQPLPETKAVKPDELG